MIHRRKFLATMMSCVYLTSAMAVVGLVGGCDETLTEAPPRTAEQEAAAKEAQNKMKEFMAAKKAGPGAQKRR